ncbi:MAG: CHAT domain-containing protein, partial [Moorea sp. SIO2I5]|nr:CHAT domain-containing protein [Moorena sp. SIO2I5]
AAKKATEKEKPKKDTALANLESVAETLETASKTVDASKNIWDKAKPIILKVAGWLGAAAGSYLLGL